MTKQGMFSTLNPKSLIFIDIETVMSEEKFSDLSTRFQDLWIAKCERVGLKLDTELLPEDAHQKLWENNAALYPEFLKIVCVSIGYYEPNGKFKTQTYINGGEKGILLSVYEKLSELSGNKLIAHKGNNFDYPVLIKRYIINKLQIPQKLWNFDKKPWEVGLLDTAQIWKFNGGGSNNAASLDLLAGSFGLPSPKQDVKGSDVYKYYYNVGGIYGENGIEKIGKYCANDVITLSNIVNSIIGIDEITPLVE